MVKKNKENAEEEVEVNIMVDLPNGLSLFLNPVGFGGNKAQEVLKNNIKELISYYSSIVSKSSKVVMDVNRMANMCLEEKLGRLEVTENTANPRHPIGRKLKKLCGGKTICVIKPFIVKAYRVQQNWDHTKTIFDVLVVYYFDKSPYTLHWFKGTVWLCGFHSLLKVPENVFEAALYKQDLPLALRCW